MTIRPAEVLSSDEEARALVNNILALVSFEKCWLIFTLRSDGASDFLPTESFQRVTARLANSLPQVVIRYAYTDEDAVSIIRIAIEEAACTSEAWEKSLSRWSNREGWLLPEETHHELFLARCPMMTPFTAQLALAAGPLRQFITSSNEARIAHNPWISPRVLELFHQFVNCAPSGEAAQAAVGPTTNKRKAPLDHDIDAQLRTAGRPAHDTYPPNSNKRPRVTASPAPAAVPAPVVPASTTSACHNCGRPGHSAWQCYSGGSTDKNPTRTTQQQCGNHNHWPGRKRKQGPAPAQQPRQSPRHSTTSTSQRTRGPAAGSAAANHRNYTNRASSNNSNNNNHSNSSDNKRARRGGR